MKVLILFTYFIILASCTSAQSFQNRAGIIREFLLEVQRAEKATADIIAEFFPVPGQTLQEQERVRILELQLEDLHKRLKDVNIEELTILEYAHMDAENKNILTERPADIYIIEYEGQFFLPVLFNDKKIESVSVMNKGARRWFF
ncbi:hypothetical protein [Parapedobacter tibetensis]|uniref:hypothetical protein n=1 Tax=Parapedobacter tibetensis TaxID=2972951 RepID=UPI00214DC5C9|nr:hypothetical protein [Parapedobacter tibetensis]